MSRNYTTDQVIGASVNAINNQRMAKEATALFAQDQNFEQALERMQAVRDFIGSPEKIIGSNFTKHGEIAESIEVGLTNARSVLEGGMDRATFDGVGRTAPADYLIDSAEVQSKFINGINNNLNKGVLDHLVKYPDFTQNGGYYHIPKDQFSIISKILNGEHVDGLSQKTINSIKNHVVEIEKKTGSNFYDVIKPGVSNYDEVQQGVVPQTLDNHERELADRNNKIKDDIGEAHKPGLTDGVKATGVAALVGGTMSFTIGLYQHYKNGKNPFKGDLTVQDWKALGITTAEGAALGGVTGGAIYALTNYASLSAPFAAAVVSAGKGLASLQKSFSNGEISLNEFTDMGLIICAESAIVGLATAAGQAIIPIPILGAVIGSLAGQFMMSLLGEDSGLTITQIQKELDEFINHLEITYKNVVQTIVNEFKRLGDLTVIAFDFESNKRLFLSSISLARAHGVKEDKILKNDKEIDNFFLG